MAEERVYPHYRRNFIALVADFAGFGLGFAFYSPSTVLPTFVSELTSSAPLIGLISTLLTGAWLLPQLFAASFLATQDRQKPYLVKSALIGRSALFLLAGITYLWAGRRPGVTLIALYLCITVLMACDAVTSVAWVDMWPKMIPPTRRGRMIGLGQVLSGLMTIGAAEVVGRVLGPAGPPFPTNYALLFLLAGLAMMLSLVALASLREPRGPVKPRPPTPWREFVPQLSQMLRADRHFRLLNIVRLLGGLSGLATPFYIVHATTELGMAAETIGLFITAQTVGSVLAGLVLGYLNERWGAKVVIQVSRLLALLQPVLALGLTGASGWLGGMLPLVYAIIFLMLGVINNALMPGFFSYLVDLAPEGDRPVYVGLSNTLSGILMVVPLAGGWLLEATTYPVLFAVTAALSGLGLLFALRLTDARQLALAPLRQAASVPQERRTGISSLEEPGSSPK